MNVGFIGFGNMARAIAGGLHAAGHAGRLAAVEPDAAHRAQATVMAVEAFADAAAAQPALAGMDVVVLAVKPQVLRAAVAALAPPPDVLYLSIAAGVRMAELQSWLGPTARIVRAMPNTPALIHAGVTGLHASPSAAPTDRQLADALMCSVGIVHWFESEAMLDAVTAVSGSGPAYVFYFIEALEEAAARLGFDAATARRFALATVAGAARLAAESDLPPAALRANVTSKGGTTERALAEFEAAQFKPLVAAAVQAAAHRARELGDEWAHTSNRAQE